MGVGSITVAVHVGVDTTTAVVIEKVHGWNYNRGSGGGGGVKGLCMWVTMTEAEVAGVLHACICIYNCKRSAQSSGWNYNRGSELHVVV